MAGLSAGDLDREVVIQQLTESSGSSGFPVESWSTLDTVWMERMAITGSERFRAAQLSAPIEARWQLHYRADMDPDLVDVPKFRRLLYLGRAYDITSAEEIGRQEGIELHTLASSDV